MSVNMTKQQQNGRARQWIGPIVAGALAFVVALVLLQPGGSLLPFSSSGPSGSGVAQVSAEPDGKSVGGAHTGVRARLAQALSRWWPHWGGNSTGREFTRRQSTAGDSTVGESTSNEVSDPQGSEVNPAGMHAKWEDFPHDAAATQVAAAQAGQAAQAAQPSAYYSAAGGIATTTPTAAGGSAAGSGQAPAQQEKLGHGLSARSGGGVEVDEVPAGSIAGKLGLQSGDVILSVNGNAISSPEDLAAIYQREGPPQSVEIIRDGRVLHRH